MHWVHLPFDQFYFDIHFHARPRLSLQDEVEHRRFAVHPFTLISPSEAEFDGPSYPRPPPVPTPSAACSSRIKPLTSLYKPLTSSLQNFGRRMSVSGDHAPMSRLQELSSTSQLQSSDDDEPEPPPAKDDGYSLVRAARRMM